MVALNVSCGDLHIIQTKTPVNSPGVLHEKILRLYGRSNFNKK